MSSRKLFMAPMTDPAVPHVLGLDAGRRGWAAESESKASAFALPDHLRSTVISRKNRITSHETGARDSAFVGGRMCHAEGDKGK